MANLRMIGGCWPFVKNIGRGERAIKLEPAIEIWGTNSEGNCRGVPKLLIPLLGPRCVVGKEKGEE
jgi:hypothetical protein